MLSPLQITRLLEHCEKIDENYTKIEEEEGSIPYGNEDRIMNQGWIQALRLVCENNTYPIRNTELKETEDVK